MSFRIPLFVSGIMLIILSISMLFPAFVDYIDDDGNINAFIVSSLISFFLGGVLVLTNFGEFDKFTIKEGFMLTSLSWLLLSIFGAIPFYLSNLEPSFTNSFFESLSGISTTGSTVFYDLDDMPRGILLWRSILQWIGGIGIVAFAIVIMPFLKIGGMQLFQTESSDRSEKIIPNSRKLVWQLLLVYAGLSTLCFFTYYFLGMSGFDAINHAMTTISTGGYSTHDKSFGFFDSIPMRYGSIIFMLLGGLPLILYVKAVFLQRFDFFKDAQVRGFLAIIITISAIIIIQLLNNNVSINKAIETALFHIVSVITTTGYATDDYTLWGPSIAGIFFFLTYLGGCAGSTSGGLKTMRILVAIQSTIKQMKNLIRPNHVFIPHYQGKALSPDIVTAVLSFLFFYVVLNTALTLALTFVGIDFTTAISGAATTVANVGPGIGDIIGPAGNFNNLPNSAKWLLCIGMFMGRLEILTVLVIFTPQFWRY